MLLLLFLSTICGSLTSVPSCPKVVRQPVIRRAAVALHLRQTTRCKKEDFDLAWFAGVKDVAAAFFANQLAAYPHRIVNRFPRVREALGQSNFSRLMEALYQVGRGEAWLTSRWRTSTNQPTNQPTNCPSLPSSTSSPLQHLISQAAPHLPYRCLRAPVMRLRPLLNACQKPLS